MNSDSRWKPYQYMRTGKPHAFRLGMPFTHQKTPHSSLTSENLALLSIGEYSWGDKWNSLKSAIIVFSIRNDISSQSYEIKILSSTLEEDLVWYADRIR